MNDREKAKSILQEVMRNYGLTERDLMGRKRYEVRAKEDAIHKIQQKTSLTLQDIADIFGFTATRVWQVVKQKEARDKKQKKNRLKKRRVKGGLNEYRNCEV